MIRHDLRYLCTRCLAALALICCCTIAGRADQSSDEFQEIMVLSGWGPETLAKFVDGAPPDDAEENNFLRLLQRLRSFDAASMERWTHAGVTPAQLVDSWSIHRGQLLRLEGRAQQIVRHGLSAEDASRLEMQEYYTCDIVLGSGEASATVVTASVPKAWRRVEKLDEAVSFTGLLVKRLSAGGDFPQYTFVAPRVAWHPSSVGGANTSFGRSVLGGFGYDVGLLDIIHNRQRISRDEYEAFYQLLSAMKQVGPRQLIRFAETNLPNVAASWRAELHAPAPRSRLAQDVIRQAEAGKYSVAPLFNDADNQLGNLVVLEGVARRVIRIDVGQTPDGNPSDAYRRFGIDHYFEIEVFTDDSQNNPLVFCVRSLPKDFPVGPALREPVRMAGFLFKSWLYHARNDALGATEGVSGQRLAPLLIGPGLVWLRTAPEPKNSPAGVVSAGLFVLTLTGIWLAVWWQSRGDRAFYRSTIATQLTLPEGRSLDDLAREVDR